MKRSTLLLAIAAVVSASAAFAAQPANSTNAWPLGLGVLESVPSHFPAEDGSPGAGRLKPLAAQVGIEFDVPGGRESAMARSIAQWLTAQIGGADDAMSAPPPGLRDFYASHERQLDEIRDLLLTAPIAWPMRVDRITHAPLPNLRAHLALTRMLVARALMRRSWEDMHAAWALQRGLTSRPEVISQLVALSSTRVVVAAARKLPAPAPAWFDEVMRLDMRRNLIAAMQYEAWDLDQEVKSEGDDEGSVPERLHDIVMKPFDQLFAGGYVDTLRTGATELARSRQCAFDGRAFDDRFRSELRWNLLAKRALVGFGTIWQRVARFTAEREVTAIVLAVKAGQTPRLSSQCSDGAWRLTQDPAGAKHIRFSREIEVRKPLAAVPLAYAVK